MDRRSAAPFVGRSWGDQTARSAPKIDGGRLAGSPRAQRRKWCNAKLLIDSFVHCTYLAVVRPAVAWRSCWMRIGQMSHCDDPPASPAAATGKAKTMFTNVEEIQKFGKQQFEAVTAATTSLSKGLQEIATETTDYSKKALAANTSVVEKLLG